MTCETCDMSAASVRTMSVVDGRQMAGFITFGRVVDFSINQLHELLSLDDLTRVYVDEDRWLNKTDFMKVANVYCNPYTEHFRFKDGVKFCGVDWTAIPDPVLPRRLILEMSCSYKYKDFEGQIRVVDPEEMFEDEEPGYKEKDPDSDAPW